MTKMEAEELKDLYVPYVFKHGHKVSCLQN